MTKSEIEANLIRAVREKIVRETFESPDLTEREVLNHLLILGFLPMGEGIPRATELQFWRRLELNVTHILEDRPLPASFFYGLSGIAYACDRIYQSWGHLGSIVDSFADVHSLMIAAGSNSRMSNCDLISGAAGIAVWAAYSKAKLDREAIANHLCDLADIDSEGVPHWKVNERVRRNIDGQDLGIAHGVPGILLALDLLRVYAGESTRESIDRFVRASLTWMLQFENPAMFNSSYPSFSQPADSRLAWCYGDLSVGYSLIYLGTRFSDAQARNAGMRAVERSFGRANSGVTDSWICHGRSGIKMMYRSVNSVIPGFVPGSLIAEWDEAIWADLMATDLADPSLDFLMGFGGLVLEALESRGQISAKWKYPLLMAGGVG